MGEPTQQLIVYLGNREAIERLKDPESGEEVRQPVPGKRCTTVMFPAGTTLMDAAQQVVHPQGVWAAHSDAPSPAWVASTDPSLAQLLASHYRTELRDPEPDHVASGEQEQG